MTRCNHCTLVEFKRLAAVEGAVVSWVVEHRPEMRGWVAVQRSDEDAPTLWFKALPAHCQC
jgi:hypothetical protein